MRCIFISIFKDTCMKRTYYVHTLCFSSIACLVFHPVSCSVERVVLVVICVEHRWKWMQVEKDPRKKSKTIVCPSQQKTQNHNNFGLTTSTTTTTTTSVWPDNGKQNDSNGSNASHNKQGSSSSSSLTCLDSSNPQGTHTHTTTSQHQQLKRRRQRRRANDKNDNHTTKHFPTRNEGSSNCTNNKSKKPRILLHLSGLLKSLSSTMPTIHQDLAQRHARDPLDDHASFLWHGAD